MPVCFASPLFRSLFASTLVAGMLACAAGCAVMTWVAGREEFRWRAQRQVQGAAELLATTYGTGAAVSAASGGGLQDLTGIWERLRIRLGADERDDVLFRVFVREEKTGDFRLAAATGTDRGEPWLDAGELLGLARLGEASFRIGPRVRRPAPSGGESIAKRNAVAAAGFREAPEREVSVLALVRAPVEESGEWLGAMGWGWPISWFLGVLVAAGSGVLAWCRVRRDLLDTETALTRTVSARGEHRLTVSRKDELGRIQSAVNELAAGWSETREEARRLQAELKESNRRVSVAEEAKSDFLANMSHEVRTPMNGILGTLNLLEETELQLDQRRLLEMAQASSQRLLRVINDILDFNKLQSTEVVLDRKRVSLEDLTLEVARIYAPAAWDNGVELRVFVDPRLPAHIEGDEARLRQVLENLIENAVKFTREGEIEVDVHAGLRENGRRFLRFSVRDTGVGISPSKQKQIFAAFSQEDSSVTRAYGGSGLGLAICKKLIDLHDGELSLESEEGKGSRFTVEIPLRPWRDPVPEPLYESIPVGARVGLAGGNKAAMAVLECYLREWGMTPVQLAGEDGQDRFREVRAILWDCGVHAGDEIGNILSKAGELGVPVLALGAMNAGAVDTAPLRLLKEIAKPFGPTELRHALGEAIRPGAESPKAASKERPDSFAKRHPARILVVEDHPMNQKIVQMMLQKLGYSVRIANNGREGADLVGRGETDLVFMDLQMPVLGGIEATREIRSNFTLSRQPVIIAMTGYALSGVRESCLAAGMNDFLTKPLSVDDLRHAIERNSQLLRAAA